MSAHANINHQRKSYAHVRMIFVLFVITTTLLLGLSLSTTQSVNKLNNEWQQYSDKSQQKFELITQLKASLGYSGFIHHFKNYVIRRDIAYLQAANKSMAASQTLLDQYHQLSDRKEELQALLQLRSVIDSYQQKLKAIDHRQALNLSVTTLDSRVRVNDSPAASALQQLKALRRQHHEQVKQHTQQLLSDAQLRVQLLTWLGVPVLIIFSLYSSVLIINTTRAKQNLENLFAVIPDGLLVIDASGQIIKANPKASDIFGYDQQEIKHINVDQLVDPQAAPHHEQYRQAFFRTRQHRHVVGSPTVFHGVHKNGELLPLDIELASFADQKNARTIAVVRSRKEELELKQRSETDHLTGTLNRSGIDRIFKDEIERCLRYQHALSLLLIDIDHFKPINDEFGHQEGDIILTTVAEILKKGSRPSDTIGRWGGDEFCILCPETNAREAAELAKRIQHQLMSVMLKHPMTGEAPTLSIGIAQLQTGDDPQSMFSRADEGLYLSKKRGRNTFSIV